MSAPPTPQVRTSTGLLLTGNYLATVSKIKFDQQNDFCAFILQRPFHLAKWQTELQYELIHTEHVSVPELFEIYYSFKSSQQSCGLSSLLSQIRKLQRGRGTGLIKVMQISWDLSQNVLLTTSTSLTTMIPLQQSFNSKQLERSSISTSSGLVCKLGTSI